MFSKLNEPRILTLRCQDEQRKRNTDQASNAILVLNWLSEQERRVDALALRADERRDKLR